MPVRPKSVNLHADDRLPPVLEERQPMATCSPLGGTVGCPKDCSGGGLCINASNQIKDKLLVRSLISESKEIVEPIPVRFSQWSVHLLNLTTPSARLSCT